jgi:DNA processing protein
VAQPLHEVTPAVQQHDDKDADRTWLAISLFQEGCSTDAARHAKDIWSVGDTISVEAVAARLYEDPGRRKVEIDRVMVTAARALEAAKPDVRLIPLPHVDYPPQLREIADPPAVLWVRGDVACLSAPAIGVVGARDALPVSLAVARTLGKELAEAGLVIVSGLARGVDGAAHGGALEGGGRTVGVLGCGIDVVYPLQHRLLADRVSQTGALVSELSPRAQPFPRHFPLRNRVISGLSRAVVVVEAQEKSGSLITARLANDQGREVMAIPGGTLSGRHRGSNALIKDGARLVETVNDVLEEIKWRKPGDTAVRKVPDLAPLNALESRMARGEGYTVEQLADRIGRSASETLVELSELELWGRVVRQPGGQFVRL